MVLDSVFATALPVVPVVKEEEEQWFRSNSELQMLEPHENLCQILDLWKDWKERPHGCKMGLWLLKSFFWGEEYV